MSYLTWFTGLFLTLSGTSHAESNDYRFWAGDIPPYSSIDAQNKPQGDLYRIFQVLVDRLGYKTKVEIVPWKRVLVDTQKNVRIFFIPVARSPDRENLYQWVEPLIDESFGLYALSERNTLLQDKERIKTLRICTLRGTSTEELARHHQFEHIETVGTNDACARLLKAGRVDAWLSAKRAAFTSFKQVGYDLKDLSLIDQLDERPLYLAASKSVPKEELQRWRSEVQKMKADGTLERLLR